MILSLVHLSDLHFGRCQATIECSERFVRRMLERSIDHIVITGDITNRGREDEYEHFLEVFAPLIERDLVTVVPGNHDRAGDDIADSMTQGERVQLEIKNGLALIKVDSTAPHNRHSFRCHGLVATSDLDAIDDALREVPRDHVVCVLMHHHPYPLPEESTLERISSLCGLPYTSELAAGSSLIARLTGRVDLLLHGHRHVPRYHRAAGPARPLHIYNAGSSVEMGWARVFHHREGKLIGRPAWIRADPSMPDGLGLRGRVTRPSLQIDAPRASLS